MADWAGREALCAFELALVIAVYRKAMQLAGGGIAGSHQNAQLYTR